MNAGRGAGRRGRVLRAGANEQTRWHRMEVAGARPQRSVTVGGQRLSWPAGLELGMGVQREPRAAGGATMARPRTSAPSTAVCTGPATPPITCTSGSARANDGQPVPDSNFWRESKSGASQAAHRYVPCHAVGVVSEATPEGGAKAAVEAHAP